MIGSVVVIGLIMSIILIIIFVIKSMSPVDTGAGYSISAYANDLLISGGISVALSPIVIILISVIAGEWPDGYAGIGPSFIWIWGIFAMIGTVIFFIISLFTDEGLYVTLRGHTSRKTVEMTLPSSPAPSDTISEWENQGSPSEQKRNVIESEKVPEVEESPMEKLEKLIERRNVGGVTSEEFEETKKEILERKPQYGKEPIEVAQKEAGVVSKSNINASDDDKFAKLDRLAEIKEKGLINEDEFEEMKKEILGK